MSESSRRLEEVEAENAELRKELRVAKEALSPLAIAAVVIDNASFDSCSDETMVKVKLGWLRCARTVLSPDNLSEESS